ncbi:MAG: LPS-assembly protein LptD [Bryobacteraceae bacterium]
MPSPNPNVAIVSTRPESPGPNEIVVRALYQEAEGPWVRLRGRAQVETTEVLLEADELDYNRQTGEAEARGNVRFKSFTGGEEIHAERAEYNVPAETGKFYEVRGSSPVKIDARPGILATNNPFSFQGKWAERINNRYILYDGFITNCKLPKPTWVLEAPKFDIMPNQRAIAHHAMFRLKRVPLFYSPVFYKSLERAPRQSGFLTPNIGNSSRRGKMIGAGYYWAINRSHDLMYRSQLFTQRGFAHNVDFRGKPRAGTDFNVFLYGVNDRGRPTDGRKEGGLILSLNLRSDLGKGFQARSAINYLTSFRFRQAFTESFNEAVFSEVNSIGYVHRNWSTFGLNFVFARNENFQSEADRDTIVIRKLPQVEFSSRDRQVRDMPLWVSFGSSAGLLRRTQPGFRTMPFIERFDVEPRVMTAVKLKGLNLIPAFSVRETLYGANRRNGEFGSQNLLRSSRQFTLDIIPPSLSRIYDAPRWMGQRVKHVIEPRANFRYVGGVNDFNSIIRFDEMDLIANTQELEVSLTNRLYAKSSSGIVSEVFSLQVFQRRFFDPDFGGAVLPGHRNVIHSSISLSGYAFLDRPRHYSPIASIFRANPFRRVGIEWRTDYDPMRGKVVNSGLTADARFTNYFVSVGHNQVHCVALPPPGGYRPDEPTRCQAWWGQGSILSPNANQFRGLLGIGQENRRGWNAAFMAIYDYQLGMMNFANTQVSYNTDCCSYSVQYRRFAIGSRNENQFRFAFSIANIGSFGTLRVQERLF